ncbi:hypothetical protein pb186bvf_013159 [Paramecium bursaria]
MNQIYERQIIGQLVNERDDSISLFTRQQDLTNLIFQDDRINFYKNADKIEKQSEEFQQSQSTFINQQSKEMSLDRISQQSQIQQSSGISFSSQSTSAEQKPKIAQKSLQQNDEYGWILFIYKIKDKEEDLYSQGNQQYHYKDTLLMIFNLFINGRPSEALKKLKKQNFPLQNLLKAIIKGRIDKTDETDEALVLLQDLLEQTQKYQTQQEKLQEQEQSQQEIQQLQENKLNRFLAFYNQGIIYLYLSDFKNAKDSFIQALLIDSSDYYVNYNIAYCDTELGNHQEARNVLINQSLVNKHKDLSFKLLGQMQIKRNNYSSNYQQAIKYFDEALYCNPNNYQLYFLKATTQLIWNVAAKKINKDKTAQIIPELQECIQIFQSLKTFQMTQERKFQNIKQLTYSKLYKILVVSLILEGLEKNKKFIEDILSNQQNNKKKYINNNIGNYYAIIQKDRFSKEKYSNCEILDNTMRKLNDKKVNKYKFVKLNLGMLELRSQQVGNQAAKYFSEALLDCNVTEQIDQGNVIQNIEKILNQFKEFEDILPQLIKTYRYWLSQSNIVAIQQKDFQNLIFLFVLKIDEPKAFEGFRFQQYYKINDDNFQNVKVFDYDFKSNEKSRVKNGINLDLNLEIKAINNKSDKIFQYSLVDNEKNYILFDKYQDGEFIKFIYMEENNIIKQLIQCDLGKLDDCIQLLQQQLSLNELQLKIILDGIEQQIDQQLYNQILALKVRYLRFKQTLNPIKALKSIKTQSSCSKEQFADLFSRLNFNQIIFICYQLAVRIQSGSLNQNQLIYLNQYQQIVQGGTEKLDVSGCQFNLMIYWLFKRKPQISRDYVELKSLSLALKKNFDPQHSILKLFGGEIDVIIDKILYKQLNKEGSLIFCCLNEIILNYNDKQQITEDQFLPSAPLKLFKIQCDKRICDINTLRYSLRAQDQIIEQYLKKIVELRLMNLTFTQQDVTNFIVVQENQNQAIFKLIFLEHQIEKIQGKTHVYRLIQDLEQFFKTLFQVNNMGQIRKNSRDWIVNLRKKFYH